MSVLALLTGAGVEITSALAHAPPARAHIEFGWPSVLSAPVFYVFLFFALGTIGGALFTVTRRNAVTAVVGLIGTFFALAGIYVLLYAHFLAVIQVLVYAGAVTVLFVFVIMILGREESAPWALRARVTKALGVGAVAFTGFVLWRIMRAPEGSGGLPPPGFGTVERFGELLFRDYLFPFEAVSLLLLMAVIGAVVIARGRRDQPGAAAARDRVRAERR
jgi:NADH-quinone oxidoreductase subunit J